MTSILSSLKPKNRLAWQIAMPLVLVLVLAALWSLYWVIAASKAQEFIDQALAREKANGLTVTCAKRRIRGYPFKFLLNCSGLKVVQETPTRLTTLTASRFAAAVMAYNFNHMIAELDGPYEVTRSRKRDQNATVVETRKLFSGTAKTLKSSIVLKNQVLKQTTVVLRGLTGTFVDYSNQSRPQEIATTLSEAILHVRSTGDVSKAAGPYDAGGVVNNLNFNGGMANLQSDEGTRFDNFVVRMNISNAPYKLRGKPLDWLKAWKANNGQAKITELAASSGAVKMKGTGNFDLDNLGRAQGILKAQMTGLDSLVKNLVSAGRIREKDADLGLAAINLLGNAGGGSVKVAIKAQKGNVYFGPFKIAILKPLFNP